MTTGGADALFLDANVLVYATAPTAPLHTIADSRIAAEQGSGRELWTSRQVLREYLCALSRPQSFTPPFSVAHLIQEVMAFQTQFLIAEDDARVTSRLLHLLTVVQAGGKQVHDANIVATMLEYNIPKLLTHNTADFARFSSFITVEPLVP